MRRVTVGRLAAGLLGTGLVLVLAGSALAGLGATTSPTAGSSGSTGPNTSGSTWIGWTPMMGSAGGHGPWMMGGADGAAGMMGGASGAAGTMGGASGAAGMMGGASVDAMGKAMGSALAGRVGQPIAPAQAEALGAATPAGATVDRSANRITFASGDVRLTMLASPPDGKDLTFRIAGLVDPTIVVARGARVSIQLINADPDMSHNVAVLDARPPFSTMPMMTGSAFAGAVSPPLGDPTSAGMPGETINFTASTSGTFTYLCQVPGHAASGMYGTFEVVGD